MHACTVMTCDVCGSTIIKPKRVVELHIEKTEEKDQQDSAAPQDSERYKNTNGRDNKRKGPLDFNTG